MQKLSREDLWSLEEYAARRGDFRAQVMEHKKNRRLSLGDHVRLYFEDRLIMHYQIQEMLRAERIFEADGIQDELDAYNPLIPDGLNLKATFMIEVPDVEERRLLLASLVGIEDRVWLQVAGNDRVYGLADEDMERTTGDKTSSVHFMRFEFSPAMIADLKAGAAMSAGTDHPAYQVVVDPVPAGIRDSLVRDFA